MKYLQVMAVAAVLGFGLTACGDPGESEPTQVAAVSSTSDPSFPELREGDTPDGGTTYEVCEEDEHAAIATDVTSCPFAAKVRAAYKAQTNANASVRAYSPVTEQHYTMQCLAGFKAATKDDHQVDAVRCFGGNNAVVVILDF